MTAPDFLLIIGAISGDNGESGTQVPSRESRPFAARPGRRRVSRLRTPSAAALRTPPSPRDKGIEQGAKAPNRVVPRSNALRPSDGAGVFYLIKKLLQSASLTAPSKRELWALSNLFFEGRLKSSPFVADLDDKSAEGMAEGAERSSRSGRNSLFKQ